MAMIGVIGHANSGKTTLINSILGQKLLPTGVTCCTSVITTVSFVDLDEPTLIVRGKGDIKGRKSIRDEIQRLNSEARGANDPPLDISLIAKPPCDKIPCDGQLKLMDLPGCNEAGNDVVKGCLKQALSMCHALLIVVAPQDVQSDGLAALIKQVKDLAPHMLRSSGSVTFIISHSDCVRDDDSDSDDASPKESSRAIEKIKGKLMDLLKEHLPDHTEWASDVALLATSVDSKLRGGHDFDKVFDIIASAHEDRQALALGRKNVLATQIHDYFKDLLHNAKYPVNAQRAIDLQQTNQTNWIKVAVFSGLITIPLGGYAFFASCAVRGAAAVATGVSSLMAGYTAGGQNGTVTLGGQPIVGLAALHAEGAAAAVSKLQVRNLSVCTSDIKDGKRYSDVSEVQVFLTRFMEMTELDRSDNNTYRLQEKSVEVDGNDTYTTQGFNHRHYHVSKSYDGMDDLREMTSKDEWLGGVDEGDGWVKFQVPVQQVVYVGEFVGKKPDGAGRMFWPSTTFESFIGTFRDGQPAQGIFINEVGFYVGQMNFQNDEEGWQPWGYQADLPDSDAAVCNVCMDRPSMVVENFIMQPCGHGHTCRVCVETLNPRQCTVCRTTIEQIGRF